jgi:hypothetical protein
LLFCVLFALNLFRIAAFGGVAMVLQRQWRSHHALSHLFWISPFIRFGFVSDLSVSDLPFAADFAAY